eukprot:1860457-Heterocapsa_arctica.AAC.1
MEDPVFQGSGSQRCHPLRGPIRGLLGRCVPGYSLPRAAPRFLVRWSVGYPSHHWFLGTGCALNPECAGS